MESQPPLGLQNIASFNRMYHHSKKTLDCNEIMAISTASPNKTAPPQIPSRVTDIIYDEKCRCEQSNLLVALWAVKEGAPAPIYVDVPVRIRLLRDGRTNGRTSAIAWHSILYHHRHCQSDGHLIPQPASLQPPPAHPNHRYHHQQHYCRLVAEPHTIEAQRECLNRIAAALDLNAQDIPMSRQKTSVAAKKLFFKY